MTDDPRTIPTSELARLLASALGQEKSSEVIASAAEELSLSGPLYSAPEARAIFERLARTEGLIGVVARFAISRGDVGALVGRDAGAPCAPRDDETAEAEPEAVDLLPLFAPALGAEKATDSIAAACARLGLDPSRLTREGALSVLDDLARAEGIVGVVARFAKARFVRAPHA